MALPAIRAGNSLRFQKLYEEAVTRNKPQQEIDVLVNHWMMCRNKERMMGERRHRQKRANRSTEGAMIWPNKYPY